MNVEAVQRALNRSRASVYRYANTDPQNTKLNVAFDPKRLNPEYRSDPEEPLLFHPNEVARFAREVLKVREIKIELIPQAHSKNEELLEAILVELQAIRKLLELGSDAKA
jgi:hypothetical protein